MITERDAPIAEIRQNLVEVLVGGNHLASVLINTLGAGPEFFPIYQTTLEGAGEVIEDPELLDLWIAWRAIMRLRDRLREIGVYE